MKCVGPKGDEKGLFLWVLWSFGDPRGSYWVIYLRFGKCMGTLGGHRQTMNMYGVLLYSM